MSLRHSALYIVALMVAPACGAHAASYNFTEINPSGAIASSAQGINDTGTIVGGYNDATGAGFGFIDIAGSFTQLAPTPAASCGAFASICNTAFGVNNAGTVVGTTYTSGGVASGFIYANNSFTALTYPAYGISNKGVIVGQINPTTGFTYQNGTYTPFTLPNLPANASFVPFGINSSNQIVGTYSSPFTTVPTGPNSSTVISGVFSVFLYTLGASSFTLLPEDPNAQTGPGEGTFGVGINDAGQVVGSFFASSAATGLGTLPFVESNGVYSTINVTLPSNTAVFDSGADGINNLGDIVGEYPDPSGELRGFLATPAAAPLPPALPMFAVGVLLIGMFIQRRRRAVPYWH